LGDGRGGRGPLAPGRRRQSRSPADAPPGRFLAGRRPRAQPACRRPVGPGVAPRRALAPAERDKTPAFTPARGPHVAPRPRRKEWRSRHHAREGEAMGVCAATTANDAERVLMVLRDHLAPPGVR
jgi:hypothetical protein